MAIVEFYKRDLENLIGHTLSDDTIENRIPMMATPVEKIDGSKIHIEVFPDRPDMLSAEGFARSLKGFLGYSKGLHKFDVKKGRVKLHINKNVKDVRPYIVSAIVKNVKFTTEIIESLIQVQEKIHETIGRKRSKVAIGIHDFDKVKPPFYYKAVNPENIKFIPLDMDKKLNMKQIVKEHPKGIYGKIIENKKLWPVIVDKNGDVLSFPPVINGELTKVTNTTKNLFIDVTGTSEDAINQALNIIVTSLAERNCKIETVENISTKKYITPDLGTRKLKVNIDYINKLLDMDLKTNELKTLLEKSGLSVGSVKGQIHEILIPPYRADIMHPIDIVEDVAISFGYEKFEPRIPKVPTISKSLEINDFALFTKNILIGLGMQETVSMILTNKENEFDKMNALSEEVCETLNPVSTECTICRKYILPSLIKSFSQNQHVEFPQKIFELGEILIVDPKEETGSKTINKLGCAISDNDVGYEQISSIVDSLLKNLGLQYKLKETKHPSFINGRTASIVIDKTIVGVVGEINPQVLENWGLEMPTVAFELNIDDIFNIIKK